MRKMIFSLAWITIFTGYWKVLVLKFMRWKIRSYTEYANMMFADYWKGLVLNCSEMINKVFFEPKRYCKDDIYWLLKSSCFELFGDRKYGLFFSQKLDGKMIFTWPFELSFIPGLGKQIFSCSKYNALL